MLTLRAAGQLSDPTLFKPASLINGAWVGANATGTFEVTDPATGKLIGVVPDHGLAETKEAIAAASEAFKTWKKTTTKVSWVLQWECTGKASCGCAGRGELSSKETASTPSGQLWRVRAGRSLTLPSVHRVQERHDALLRLYKLMCEHNADLGAIITLENGKPLTEAKGEASYSASFLEWFAEEAVRDYGDVISAPLPGVRNVVIKQPVGVVGLITPCASSFAVLG